MYNVVGLNEKDTVSAESFSEALKIFHERCIEPLLEGKSSRMQRIQVILKPKEKQQPLLCTIHAYSNLQLKPD
jgi:hypothetical protein